MKIGSLQSMAILMCMATICGCSGDGSSAQPYNFRTGSEGVSVNFGPQTPDRFYSGSGGMPFLIELRNKGAFPQRGDTADENDFSLMICVGGFDEQIIGINAGSSKCIDGDDLKNLLFGKGDINPQGGYTTQTLTATPNTMPSGLTSYPTSLIVAASYKYKTYASPLVCIDKEPFQFRQNRPCNVADYKSIDAGTQGGPVAVSRVEEEAYSGGALFRVYIKNVGGGTVIDTAKVGVNPLEYAFSWDEVDTVKINDVKVGNIDADCQPLQVRLVNGEGQFFCELKKITQSSVYETPLNIILEYGYVSTISKEIELVRQPGMGEVGGGAGSNSITTDRYGRVVDSNYPNSN